MLTEHLTPTVGPADVRLVESVDRLVDALPAIGDTVFGWSADELVGIRTSSLVHPDDHEILGLVRERARRSGTAQSVHLRIRTSGARWLWVECRCSISGGAWSGGASHGGASSCGADHESLGQGPGCIEFDMRDVSALYLRDETTRLLVDVRAAISLADTVDRALLEAISRLARWGGFRDAVAWTETDAGWAPRVGTAPTERSQPPSSPTETDRRHGVEATAHRQAATWSDPLDFDAPADRRAGAAHAALLVPIVADRNTLVVVELLGGDSADGPSVQAVLELARHLGHAVRRKRSESELALAGRRFGVVFEEAAIGMALVAPEGRFLDANVALCRLLGHQRSQLAEMTFQEVTHPDDLGADLGHIEQVLAGHASSYQTEKRYVRSDGSVIWGALSVSLVRDESGDPLHFIAQVQDISQRKQAERELNLTIAELARKERRYRALVEPSGDVIARVSVDGFLQDINRRGEAALGASRADLVSRHLSELLPRSVAEPILERVERVSVSGQPDEMWRQWLVPADRDPGWFVIRLVPETPASGSGAVEHVHLVAGDITEIVENEQRLSAMALVDPLTGLSNRAAVLDRLQHALDRLGRLDDQSAAGVAVAIVDLDDFKSINDMFGHAAGDEALRGVADALQRAVRAGDTVGRLGGDEFIVVFEDVANVGHAVGLGERLRDGLARTAIDVGSETRAVLGSVGVVFTQTVLPVSDVVARADRAMYQAKRQGGGRSWAEDDHGHDIGAVAPARSLRGASRSS